MGEIFNILKNKLVNYLKRYKVYNDIMYYDTLADDNLVEIIRKRKKEDGKQD
jgi:hypothetical protein